MPIDWDQFERDLDDAIDTGASETDRQLAGRVSQLTSMTREEIQELFPDSADLKKLSKLMEIVKSADDRNTKVNRIVENAEEFGGIVLTLLNKLA
ncbi:hypothetical protein [Microbulbifer yueqingensis]|uniref:Uncharacterized protein n=1 Tax=Microbulbifer yueqingensis TaxID=658219 RepID=A0A1G9DR34_9GAMM|nr:hypothetical protein [Microbulbifer yueqingensis]SDK66341.1 hypothetical protein SAMN05216212_2923 [Microbulbifer yueqingensis]